MRTYTTIVIAALFFIPSISNQSTNSFTDSRDGQIYKTFSFTVNETGIEYTWMAQNLNYKLEGSYAYDNDEVNREKLGLLYTWEVARKACPCGWHLATDDEWSLLVNEFGGFDKAGAALKSNNGWNEDGNGINSSGFNALPAGLRRVNGYEVLGYFGFWWSSTPAFDTGKAWGWDISYGGPDMSIKSKIFRYDSDISNAVSVRCVQDL